MVTASNKASNATSPERMHTFVRESRRFLVLESRVFLFPAQERIRKRLGCQRQVNKRVYLSPSVFHEPWVGMPEGVIFSIGCLTI